MSEVSYPCYCERRDSNGQWYWVYYDEKQKPVARSSDTFQSRADCKNSIAQIQKSLDHPIYYAY